VGRVVCFDDLGMVSGRVKLPLSLGGEVAGGSALGGPKWEEEDPEEAPSSFHHPLAQCVPIVALVGSCGHLAFHHYCPCHCVSHLGTAEVEIRRCRFAVETCSFVARIEEAKHLFAEESGCSDVEARSCNERESLVELRDEWERHYGDGVRGKHSDFYGGGSIRSLDFFRRFFLAFSARFLFLRP